MLFKANINGETCSGQLRPAEKAQREVLPSCDPQNSHTELSLSDHSQLNQ